MALTVAGRRLTESHRLAQQRIGIDTARQMSAVWRLLDVTELDRTVAAWLRVAVPLVERQNARSASLASSYYRLFRATELGTPIGDFTPAVMLTADAQRVMTSLTVTGPVSVKNAMVRNVPLDQASDTAMTNTARAAHRLALDGGRSSLMASASADPRVLGYQRVTSGDPCEFCEALADKGVAFSEDSATFAAHDGCSCSAEPVYETGQTGERRDVREFEARDLTDQQRETANQQIRDWLARRAE